MLRSFFALVFAIWAGGQIAYAYTVGGQGGQTCGKWLEDRNRNDIMSRLDEAWVLGFVSASNKPFLVGPEIDILKNADNSGIFAWLDAYCARHPLDLIADAAVRLVDILAHRAVGR
jgi:hypothetical protein